MTYTYVILDVSPGVFEEILQAFLEAKYDHAISEIKSGEEIIDMHGIALRKMKTP